MAGSGGLASTTRDRPPTQERRLTADRQPGRHGVVSHNRVPPLPSNATEVPGIYSLVAALLSFFCG